MDLHNNEDMYIFYEVKFSENWKNYAQRKRNVRKA